MKASSYDGAFFVFWAIKSVSSRQKAEGGRQKAEGAHFTAKGIMANEELASAAQVRLNVTRNKLYTALIKEYFKKKQEG